MTKGVTITLNDEYLDKIIEQLTEMKTNNNKMIQLFSGNKTVAVAFKHKNAKRKTQ